MFASDGKLAFFLNRLGCLFVLNILTMLCCVPLVTAGAAMTALYTMTLRLNRNEEGKIIAGYFRAFRDNFKQSTKIWLAGGGILLFLSFDIWLMQRIDGTFGQVYRILLFVLLMLSIMLMVYVFAVLARFDNSVKNTVKNALLFCVGHVWPAFLILFATLSPGVLLAVSYRFWPVVFLLGISGPAYLASIYFTSLFKQYEGEEI